MGRIQRPLDADACGEADEKLYAQHARDSRPNPLYTADGERLRLDANRADQESLRREWVEYYMSALDKRGAPHDAEHTRPAGRDRLQRDVGHTVGNCPGKHWISLKLEPAADGAPRASYSWWPATAPGYTDVPYTAEITDGFREGKLGAEGTVRFDGIPCGTCQFVFDEFYEDVVNALTVT
jgi:hypothetical protein